MKAIEVFHEKRVLFHSKGQRMAVLEVVIWRVPQSQGYPEGVKYRAWLSENGQTIFGFDNHQPKGPHLHVVDKELGYVFRGIKELREDILAMILEEGFIYEN
jgi:hypothetical protein